MILIVDDNTFNVYSLKLLIEQFFKFECDIAYSAKEALEKFKDRLNIADSPYRIVLTDINMPEMDGLQMSRIMNRHISRRNHLSSYSQNESSLTRIDTKIYAVTAMNDDQINDTY